MIEVLQCLSANFWREVRENNTWFGLQLIGQLSGIYAYALHV
jgi:hypothetical protein